MDTGEETPQVGSIKQELVDNNLTNEYCFKQEYYEDNVQQDIKSERFEDSFISAASVSWHSPVTSKE